MKRAFGLMLASSLCFSFMAFWAKGLMRELPQWQVVFYRCLFNLILVTPFVWRAKTPLWPRKNAGILWWRSIVGAAGIYFTFYSLPFLPFAVNSVLIWLSPIFVVLFAWTFGSERPNFKQVISILLAFVGIHSIVNPAWSFEGPHYPEIYILMSLAGSVCGGLAYHAIRKAQVFFSSQQIVFSFTLVSTILIAPLGLANHVAPSMWQWLSLFGVGALAFVAQLLMTEAYRFAPAHVVSPMSWFTVLFNTLQGIIFLSETLSVVQVLGFLLVAVGVYATAKGGRGSD